MMWCDGIWMSNPNLFITLPRNVTTLHYLVIMFLKVILEINNSFTLLKNALQNKIKLLVWFFLKCVFERQMLKMILGLIIFFITPYAILIFYFLFTNFSLYILITWFCHLISTITMIMVWHWIHKTVKVI